MSKSFSKTLLVFGFIFTLIIFRPFLTAQEKQEKTDKKKTQKQEKQTELTEEQTFEITVTAPRIEIPLKENPAATTVVTTPLLQSLPKSIALDEVMKLVPGVRVDNQADGERLHFYIRGIGILSERGTRGIKTMVDGVPLNDPTGFVSDFYDVDWATVNKIEVLRGPAAALYGSASSGGVLNIFTRDGAQVPLALRGYLTGGSYGFYKGQAELGGTVGALNYRISGSGLSGDGYRDHSKYSAKNFYGKFNLKTTKDKRLTFVIGWTDFFNENPEGLNLAWFSSDPENLRRLANPDSYTFNEYQDIKRLTTGVNGSFSFASNLDLHISTYWRNTQYEESVPSSVIHRKYDTPGLSLQLNHRSGKGKLKNYLSLGIDYGYQSLDEYKHPNLGDALEGPELQSDQTMTQTGTGIFLIDRLELGSFWSISSSLRYDKISNNLDDHLQEGGIDLSGKVAYENITGRIGAAWNPLSHLGIYASWGTGFLPPGTEELVNNPYSYGGYNTELKAATTRGEEIGARGTLVNSLVYDVTLFHLKTKNDFGRYRMKERPLETFYGNVGSTNRYGLETSLSWFPVESLAVRLAYTYSHFKYVSVESFDAGVIYKNTWLPNSPQHQLYLECSYKITEVLTAGASFEHVSSWYIDATNRIFSDGYGKTNPYNLFNIKLSYQFTIGSSPWHLFVNGRNIFNEKYYGFTEPDPDGNSYQPAPTAEWSVGLRFGFGPKQS